MTTLRMFSTEAFQGLTNNLGDEGMKLATNWDPHNLEASGLAKGWPVAAAPNPLAVLQMKHEAGMVPNHERYARLYLRHDTILQPLGQ
jgi:hypothetical protein